MLSEKDIIRMLKEEYDLRLNAAMNEIEVFDDSGNMLLTPGLKVRHKKTQYEYTVDSVTKDPATGDLQVMLKNPDQPRFEPPPEEEEVIIGSSKKDVMNEQDPPEDGPSASAPVLTKEPQPGDRVDTSEPPSDEDDEVFVIDQGDFEKEYEVK